MALVPYTITAIERDTVDSTASGKQVVVGAVCSMFLQPSDSVVLLYDDAAGSNGSTAKTTGENGQVTVYVNPDDYKLSVNGVSSFVTIGNPNTASLIFTSELSAQNRTTISGRVVELSEGDIFTVDDGEKSTRYSVKLSGSAPDINLGSGLWGSVSYLSVPIPLSSGASSPIISAPIQNSTTAKWWANKFSGNFSLSDGGENLNDTASGLKDGSNNTIFGFSVMPIATTTYASTAMGFASANALTTGHSLTAYGYQSGIKLTTGNNNSLFGTDAGFNLTTGNNNTLVGRHVFFDGVAEATGDNNSCLGYDIALTASTFNNMVVIGAAAHRDATESARSVILGSSAGQDVNVINDSVIIGRQAIQSLPSDSVVSNDVLIGVRVNENGLSSTSNAIVGRNCFFTLAQGLAPTTGNAALGSQAGSGIYGQFNTLIGNRAGAYVADTNLNGAVCIGYRAGDGHASDNDLIIANSQVVSNALINGNFSTRVLQLEAQALTMKNIPTVGTGDSGTIWNDAGTLKVVL
jgi:hypothetical protein